MTTWRNLLMILAAAALIAPTRGYGDPARAAMKEGVTRYKKGNHEEALDAFTTAAEAADEEELDEATAFFNAANALHQLNRYDEAGDLYMRALRSDDLDLVAKAYFNRGNALVGAAQSKTQSGGMEEAIHDAEEALAMYENAMMLSSDAEDPKVNYELTQRFKETLEEMLQQQQQQQQGDEEGEPQDGGQEGGTEGPPSNEVSEDQQAGADEGDEPGEQDGRDQRPAQDGADEDQQAASGAMAAEDMTAEEAALLLDAMRDEEQASRELLRLLLGESVPVEKDW